MCMWHVSCACAWTCMCMCMMCMGVVAGARGSAMEAHVHAHVHLCVSAHLRPPAPICIAALCMCISTLTPRCVCASCAVHVHRGCASCIAVSTVYAALRSLMRSLTRRRSLPSLPPPSTMPTVTPRARPQMLRATSRTTKVKAATRSRRYLAPLAFHMAHRPDRSLAAGGRRTRDQRCTRRAAACSMTTGRRPSPSGSCGASRASAARGAAWRARCHYGHDMYMDMYRCIYL